MASTIQLKTGTGSAVPSSLTQGEVAINVDNGLIYYGSGSVNSVKQLETFTNITASAISSSGHIFADRISIDDGDSSFAGQVTVEGDIVANRNITGDNQTVILGIKQIISNDFVSSSQLISEGNITASLNISASGDIFATRFIGNGTGITDYRYANLLNIPSGIISSSLQNLGNITGSNISASGNIIGGAITSNGNAVISQSGAFTNNEFIVAVGDSAVTSSDALAVDSNGNLGIGTPNPEVRLHMLGEDAQTTQILMEQFNNSADAPDIRTRRYRGTSASRADVQTGDYLFRLNVHGQDDGSSELYGSMRFDVDSSDQDALEWGLQTRDTAGNVADRIKIDSSGDTIFSGSISSSGNITAPSYTGQLMALDRLNYYITINNNNYFLGRNVGVESGDFDIAPTSPFSINDEQVFAANILPVPMATIGLRTGIRVAGAGTCQLWITTGSRSDWPTAATVPLGFGASGSLTMTDGQDFGILDIPEFSVNDDCDAVYIFVRTPDTDNPTMRITGQLYGRTR